MIKGRAGEGKEKGREEGRGKRHDLVIISEPAGRTLGLIHFNLSRREEFKTGIHVGSPYRRSNRRTRCEKPFSPSSFVRHSTLSSFLVCPPVALSPNVIYSRRESFVLSFPSSAHREYWLCMKDISRTISDIRGRILLFVFYF